VRIDLPFKEKDDALVMVEFAKKMSEGASSINEGLPNEEIAFVDYELCGHEEGISCAKVERLEVRSAES